MSELGARRFEPGDAARWDAFVEESLNGTIFHRRRFLEYHPPGRFEDHSLLLWKGSKLVGLLPAARIERKGRPILKSHPGASYGGLVVAEPPGLRDASRMVELVCEVAAGCGFEGVELRSAEKIFERRPCDELEFALTLHGFRAVERELSTCYDLEPLGSAEPPAERILASFDPACARATRRSLAGGLEALFCTREEQYRAYWTILAENLVKHGARPTHSPEELWSLRSRFPEDVQLIAVYEGELLVAGLVAFVCNPRAAHVFYFASRPERQQLRPLNRAVFELLRFAARRGLRYVNFGISTEGGGSFVNWGLFRFKEGFGGGGALRTYWARELDA